MIFNNYIKSEIKKQALQDAPKETCGLIVSVSGDLIIHPCKNISYHSRNNCIINPLDYVKAARSGEIVGYYHSHENENLSFLDNLNAFNHNIYSIVYSWGYDKFYLIEPKLQEYLYKDFKIGENDCFSLIRNYYKNNKKINISDYNRDEKWAEKTPNIILDNFKKEGFVKVDYKDIKEDDIIVFNINGILSHFSIYLGNNFILHHPRNEKSLISEITEPLQKRIGAIFRYNK